MFCPSCNAEIEGHAKKQCPQCDSLLLEIAEQEFSESGVDADKAPGEGSPSTEPDEFDALLAGIAADIDQILAADKEDAADGKDQVLADDETPAEEPEAVIELTDSIEPEETSADDLDDYPIDDLDPLIQEFDELIELDKDSTADSLSDDEPQALEQDEVPAEEPEAVIELTESIGPEDVVELEAGSDLDPEPIKDDGLLEEIGEDDLLSVDVVEEITEDDFGSADVIEEITEYDLISDDAPDSQVAVDDEVIEEITADDFVSVRTLPNGAAAAASIEAPAKSERTSKTVKALMGMVVLLLAAGLGGRFYFKTKPAPATIPLKPSTRVAQKRTSKVSVPKESAIRRKPQTTGQSSGQQQTDTVKSEPAADKPKVAGSPQQVGAEQKPRVAGKEIEPPITETAKSPSDMAAAGKAAPPRSGEASSVQPAASAYGVKGDTAGSDIAAGEPYFTIQVATLRDKAKTDSSLAKLRQDGYAAYVSEKVDSAGAVRYKLRIGKYKTRKAAKQAAESYFGSKQAPYIIVQSKEAIDP